MIRAFRFWLLLAAVAYPTAFAAAALLAEIVS